MDRCFDVGFFGFFWIFFFGWDASKRGEDVDWVWIGFRLVGMGLNIIE